MAARQLPPQPNLSYLKNEAKRLHRAVAGGDIDAVQTARAHLRRLADLDDAAVARADVTLQETQHALACEYGFPEWAALLNAIDSGSTDELADLARLSKRDAELFLRDADSRDLVTVLATLDGATVDHLLQAASPRNQIRDDIGAEPATSDEQISEARRRLLNNLRTLAGQGLIRWPPDGSPDEEAADVMWSSRCRDIVCQPVADLSQDDIACALDEIARNARAHGLLACEGLAREAHELIGEGLRMAIDGFEPDLIEDLLYTRTWAQLRRRRERMLLSLEAMASVLSGDNPRIVAYKLETFYREQMTIDETAGMSLNIACASFEHLRDTLLACPFYDRSSEQMKQFFVAAAIVRRRDGVHALPPLAQLTEDPLLRHMLTPPAQMDPWIQTAQELIRERLETCGHRARMATAGIVALQGGATPEAVVQAVKSAERLTLQGFLGGV